jgi:hypothetical protein
LIRKQYTFTELMSNAPVNKVYEVIQPNVTGLNGNKIYLQETETLKARTLKELTLSGSHKENGSDNIIKLYGGYTAPTTRYRIVDSYVEVNVLTALDMIKQGKDVFVKDRWGDYEKFGRFTDFEDIEVRDLDDLFERKLYTTQDEVNCASCPF